MQLLSSLYIAILIFFRVDQYLYIWYFLIYLYVKKNQNSTTQNSIRRYLKQVKLYDGCESILLMSFVFRNANRPKILIFRTIAESDTFPHAIAVDPNDAVRSSNKQASGAERTYRYKTKNLLKTTIYFKITPVVPLNYV